MDMNMKVILVLLAIAIAVAHGLLGAPLIQSGGEDGEVFSKPVIWLGIAYILVLAVLAAVFKARGKLRPFLLILLGFLLVKNLQLGNILFLYGHEIVGWGGIRQNTILLMPLANNPLLGITMVNTGMLAMIFLFGGLHAASRGFGGRLSRLAVGVPAIIGLGAFVNILFLILLSGDVYPFSTLKEIERLSEGMRAALFFHIIYSLSAGVLWLAILIVALVHSLKQSINRAIPRAGKIMLLILLVSYPVFVVVLLGLEPSAQPPEQTDRLGRIVAQIFILLGGTGIAALGVSNLIRQFRGGAESSA